MSSISTRSEITRGRAMSGCSLGIRTFVVRGLCKAARDWGALALLPSRSGVKGRGASDEFFDHTGAGLIDTGSRWQQFQPRGNKSFQAVIRPTVIYAASINSYMET